MSQLLFSFSSSDKIQPCVMKWFHIQISFLQEIYLLCQQNLSEHEDLCYSVQNNHITLIRLIIPIIHTLSVFFLKLMEYPPSPLNSALSATTKASCTTGNALSNYLVAFLFWQLLKKVFTEFWKGNHVCFGIIGAGFSGYRLVLKSGVSPEERHYRKPSL